MGYSTPSRSLLDNKKALLLNGTGLLLLLLFCLFAGLISVFFPWWFVIALCGLPLFLILAATFPQVASILIIAAIAGVVPDFLLPQISVGAGKILPQDLFLISLLALAGFHILNKRALSPFKKEKIFGKLMLGMIICAAFGVVIGAGIYGAAPKESIAEFRDKIYWLLFFFPVIFIQTERDLKTMTNTLVILGLWIAIAVLIQFQFNITLLSNARVEDLATGASKYSDVTRSTAGGGIYWVIFALFVSVARILNRSGNLFISLIIATICAGGILVSFGRGIWIASFLALLLLAHSLGGMRSVVGAIVFSIAATAIAIVPLTILKPAFLEALVERVISTKDEGAQNSSLGWRLEENSFALKQIARNPVTGTGLAVTYKPKIDHLASFDQTRYIHNSYLGLWMKMGFTSILFAGLLIWNTLKLSSATVKSFRKKPLVEIAAAAGATFFVPLLTSVTQPEWLIATGISTFAMMCGLIVAFRNLQSKVQ